MSDRTRDDAETTEATLGAFGNLMGRINEQGQEIKGQLKTLADILTADKAELTAEEQSYRDELDAIIAITESAPSPQPELVRVENLPMLCADGTEQVAIVHAVADFDTGQCTEIELLRGMNSISVPGTAVFAFHDTPLFTLKDGEALLEVCALQFRTGEKEGDVLHPRLLLAEYKISGGYPEFQENTYSFHYTLTATSRMKLAKMDADSSFPHGFYLRKTFAEAVTVPTAKNSPQEHAQFLLHVARTTPFPPQHPEQRARDAREYLMDVALTAHFARHDPEASGFTGYKHYMCLSDDRQMAVYYENGVFDEDIQIFNGKGEPAYIGEGEPLLFMCDERYFYKAGDALYMNAHMLDFEGETDANGYNVADHLSINHRIGHYDGTDGKSFSANALTLSGSQVRMEENGWAQIFEGVQFFETENPTEIPLTEEYAAAKAASMAQYLPLPHHNTVSASISRRECTADALLERCAAELRACAEGLERAFPAIKSISVADIPPRVLSDAFADNAIWEMEEIYTQLENIEAALAAKKPATPAP